MMKYYLPMGRFVASHLKNDPKTSCNAEMTSAHLRKFCSLNSSTSNLLEGAITKLGLSARGSDRILKVARTIADLSDSSAIQSQHVAEAIQYRTIDRMR